MGQTAVEKIAEYHLADAPPDRPLREGDYVSIWPRHVMTHVNTPAVFRKFQSMGATKVRAPRQPVICWGHESAAPPRPDLRRQVEEFARTQGMDFLGGECGSGLRFMAENGYVLPGSFVVASDPRTTLAGALGAIGTPVVRTDAAMIWATGEFWWQVPRTVQVVLSGFLRPGVTGIDVIHALRRIYGRGEAMGAAIEFVGPGISTLEMNDRFEIALGAAEWGAIAVWFPVDGVTMEFLEERRRALAHRRPRRIQEVELEDLRLDPLMPDPDADYAARIRFDLGAVATAGAEGKHAWEELRSIEERPGRALGESATVEILEGFPERIRGRLVFLPVDELDTRAICGDAGDADDPSPENIARTVLERVDPCFADATRPGDLLVGGYVFGCGPSSEAAATVFKAKGFPMLAAGSFAATYRRHAINNGIITVECPDLIERLTAALEPGRGSGPVIVSGETIEFDFVTSTVRWRDETYRFPPFTRIPQLIVAAGGVETLLRHGVGAA